jgi:hypothetical protein
VIDMSKTSDFIAIFKDLCNDDSHGYDQTYRWGPNYDCSSSIYYAANAAGFNVPTGYGYTGSMIAHFTAAGFTAYPYDGNPWDCPDGTIFLNVANHVEVWIGGQLWGFHANEWGGITGGASGDQTGREASAGAYYSFPWDYVLIPPEGDSAPSTSSPLPEPPYAPQPSSTIKDDDTALPTGSTGTKYCTHDQYNGWLPEVSEASHDEETGYAGDYGYPIDGFACTAPEYRVHYLGGSWEVPVSAYDINDGENGMAGDYGKSVDGIAIKDRSYQVHTQEDGWIEPVDGYDINDSEYGYAGILGHAIDGIRIG